MKEHERTILIKIKTYANQAIRFKEGMGFNAFSSDEKTIAACVHNLSQIGELAGRLSEDFIITNPRIPCHKIKGMRNRIVHNYEGIQLNIVWDVLEDFLPKLIQDIDEII